MVLRRFDPVLGNRKGSALIGVVAVLAIAMIITAGLLVSSTGTLAARRVVESNAKNFYEVERTINAVAAWLQTNSKNIVRAFDSSNFNTNFDLGDPVTGANQGSAFVVPTLIKMKNTNNAVQLTNDSYFGTSAFPNTTNIDTNAAFNAVSAFQAASFGTNARVRVLAVWALATNGHYQPIFRIDAITGGSGPEHGVHGINFIKSALVTGNSGVGYYAEDGDFQTGNGNNDCWSYQYSWDAGASTWTRGAARSNCLITGQDDIQIKSAIHGSVMTNKNNGINLDGGSISGTRCEAPGCVSYTLPARTPYATTCAGVTGQTVTAGVDTPVSAGGTLASQCYQTITVNSNKSIVFNTPNVPYYIRDLTLQNNSNSKLKFTTVGPGNKYILYVDNFAGGIVNGNQLVATNLAPNQLEIHLTQHGTFRINGTASMNAVIIGNDNHTIEHNGNFRFYGALRSNAVNVTGNATLGYDEDLGGSLALTDINFTLFKASQRYR